MSSRRGWTKHHVPPKHPDENPIFIKEKRNKHQEAYRLLFGKAQSLTEALDILQKDWWQPKPKRHPHIKPVIKKPNAEHVAYNLLFHNAKSFEDAAEILKHDWWPSENKT
ncbi:MAG: hypothetical protein KGJ89_03520 [Patescibacteria group bacterium]|nr:hypothetical protein [Patescibacteria group bacterium]MDE2015384.1 hypothetical protein [Patescibacteria group bacterium]MDE2227001.1 hypothetical protein [Patescibacteria group bacterium]